ncbi:hypothetical protein JXB31_03700 [Candidatus Woesearchaeota archaeon]|nr:hypothetical protein [Candidatus Woesearchaeota archaeon]
MQKLKILNSKEKKALLRCIDEQYGCMPDPSLTYLMNSSGKVYIINPDLSRLDDRCFRTDSVGLYLGTKTPEGVRLSIEGSQIIGRDAKRNIIDVKSADAKRWLYGENISTDEQDSCGFVIVRCKCDIIGCGKIKDGHVLNYVPKARRTNTIDI